MTAMRRTDGISAEDLHPDLSSDISDSPSFVPVSVVFVSFGVLSDSTDVFPAFSDMLM